MLAIVLDHYHLRNDVRRLSKSILEQKPDTIFFVTEAEKHLAEQDLPVRVMRPLKNSIKNKILKQLYFYFGNLPSTRENHFHYVSRRLHSHNKSTSQFLFQKIKFYAQRVLPDLISFDGYIKNLQTSQENLEDVTAILSFTDINNENFIAHAVQTGKKLYTYAYSWDHPAKFRRYSKDNTIKYITWSNKLSEDLWKTHEIKPQNTIPLAASQYTFIADYLKKTKPTLKENIFYFVASFGYPKLVEQEILIVKEIARIIQQYFPDHDLIFRPYPVLKDWAPYEELKKIRNLKFDNFEKSEGLLLEDADLDHKLCMIQKSKAVIHCGTTIGIEASYFETPVIYACPADLDYTPHKNDLNHISWSWNQFHLKRHYFLPEFNNVTDQASKIRPALHTAINHPENLMPYNHQLREISKLISMEELTQDLINIMLQESES